MCSCSVSTDTESRTWSNNKPHVLTYVSACAKCSSVWVCVGQVCVGLPAWTLVACEGLCVCVCGKNAEKQILKKDLKTNNCQGSGPGMTSVDKRLCVDFSGAGDSSALQRWGGERHFSSVKRQKHQKSELRVLAMPYEISDRGYSYSCCHGGFVARSVKNESPYWCRVFIMSTFDVKKPHW